MDLHSYDVSACEFQPASPLKDILSIYVLEKTAIKRECNCKVGFLLDVLLVLHSAKGS